MTEKPTPTPWSYRPAAEGVMFAGFWIEKATGTKPDVINETIGSYVANVRDNEANAALIVRAVNSHAKLVEALRDSLNDAEGYARTHGAGPEAAKRIRARCDRARAALALAKEKTTP